MEADRRQLIEAVRVAAAKADTEAVLLQATVELIDRFSEGYNWTGFYMMAEGRLELGPYLGEPTEHARIELDRGICGAAATQKRTVMVDDVHADSRHIACSLSTRSEIVVPLMDGDCCLGEIDIDSDQPAFFTAEDRTMLEAVAEIVVEWLRQLRNIQ